MELSMPESNSILNTFQSGMADCRHYSTGDHSPAVAPGPMVDDGSPYSAIGLIELELLLGKVVKLQQLPKSFQNFKFWQFGCGAHASRSKPILWTHYIKFTTDS